MGDNANSKRQRNTLPSGVGGVNSEQRYANQVLRSLQGCAVENLCILPPYRSNDRVPAVVCISLIGRVLSINLLRETFFLLEPSRAERRNASTDPKGFSMRALLRMPA